MQVTARVDYAVRAVIEIVRADGQIMRKTQLSEAQDIPARFLEQILAQLVRSGILSATRGPAGGYSLAKPASSVSVADIVRAIDGPLAGVRGVPPEQLDYAESAQIVQSVWVALRASMRVVLEETTVADLAAGSLPAPVTELLEQPGAWERR